MKQKAYIKPTKPGLIVGLIVIIAFLAFGIFFFTLLSGEPDAYIGQIFLIIWIIIVLVIGGSFVNNLINYDKNPVQTATLRMLRIRSEQQAIINSTASIHNLGSFGYSGRAS
jgi:hypothetical protein